MRAKESTKISRKVVKIGSVKIKMKCKNGVTLYMHGIFLSFTHLSFILWQNSQFVESYKETSELILKCYIKIGYERSVVRLK